LIKLHSVPLIRSGPHLPDEGLGQVLVDLKSLKHVLWTQSITSILGLVKHDNAARRGEKVVLRVLEVVVRHHTGGRGGRDEEGV